MLDIQEIIQRFKEKPYLRRMNSKNIAKSKNHPNIGNILSSRQHLCSKCGSEHIEKIEGEYYFTSVSKYELFRCKKCGSISRGRNNLNKNTNKTTTVEK